MEQSSKKTTRDENKKPTPKDQKLLPAPKTRDNKSNTKNETRNRLFDPISNKNFIMSQIIILSVGLALAGLMYFILQKPLENSTDIGKYIPVTKEPISFNLEVTGPENNTVVFKPEVLVDGNTSSSATVVISTNNNDQAVNANEQGSFSETVSLDPGLNTIVINTFNESGENKSEIRNVYYSEEKL